MEKTERILRLLEQMPLSLLKAISRLDPFSAGTRQDGTLSRLAITTPSSSDRITFNQLGNLVESDEAVFAFTIGAAQATFRARENSHPIQLVISGPEIEGESVRDTAAVVTQLISSAKTECLLMTYVLSHADIPLSLLISAARSGVKITCVFDMAPLRSMDTRTEEGLRELQELGAELKCWSPRHGLASSMHAKAVITDRAHCLITSANLTARALTQNVELGTLFTDGSKCLEIIQHCDRLRESGWLRHFLI